MDFNDFLLDLIDSINDKLGDEDRAEVNNVIKNNGLHLCGVCIKNKEYNAAPTVYVNHYYDEYCEGMTIDEISDDIIRIYNQSKLKKDINIGYFTSYKEVKDKLFCKLINYEKNEELLSYTPHKKYLDLAIVVYCQINNLEIGDASILVRNSHLNFWDVDENDLIKEALANTYKNMKCVVSNIVDALDDMLDEEALEKIASQEVPLYVATNEKKLFGAIFMAFPEYLRQFCELIGGEYYILPSSIHEILLFPANECEDEEYINAMIREINDTTLSVEEVLSNHAYRYSDDEQVLIF